MASLFKVFFILAAPYFLPYPLFVRKYQDPEAVGRFILIGAIFAVMIGWLVPDPDYSHLVEKSPKDQAVNERSVIPSDISGEVLNKTEKQDLRGFFRPSDPYMRQFDLPDFAPQAEASEQHLQLVKIVLPHLQQNFPQSLAVTELSLIEKVPAGPAVYPRDELESGPYIVVIIDDMGLNISRSREVESLTGPLTLSYLPYAERVEWQVSLAKGAGHGVMLHMPMEPVSGAMLTSTPGILHVSMTRDEFDTNLKKNLEAFDGYQGINNHMGSKMTQNDAFMTRVMALLKARGLYFIDSRTISSSVAAEVAAREGVPHAVRDVFIDHEPTLEFVKDALANTERIAAERGYAIAIGHPKEVTIEGLRQWLPGLREKGFTLITADQLIKKLYQEPILSE